MGIARDKDLAKSMKELLAVATTDEVQEIARLLLSGELSESSDTARVASLPVSSATASALTRLLGSLGENRSLSVGHAAGLALATSVQAREGALQAMPSIDLVWTGPAVQGSPARTTHRALIELVAEARSYLLVVEYALSTTFGAGREVRERIITAQKAGVVVTLIAHADEMNRAALRDWPVQLRPRVLTWPMPATPVEVKVHAKVAVADDRAALVTSANLTHLGLRENMELGVLIHGPPAATIRRHFEALERAGVFRPWSF